MSVTTAFLVNFGVLALVLSSDLGRRRLGAHRLVRPLMASGVVTALYLHGVPSSGPGLELVAGATLTGALLGLASTSLVRVERTRDGAFTIAGVAYAAFWTTASVLRFGFSFGMEHLFGADVVRFLAHHQIPVDALTDAIVGMSLAMVVVRTLALVARSRAATPWLAAAHA